MFLRKYHLFFALLFLIRCSSNEAPAPVDCTVDKPSLSVDAQENPTGCFTQDGSITVAAEGKAPFEFSINGGVFQASPTFDNLNGGTFNIKVKDANGCENVTEVILTTPASDLMATVQTELDTECTTNNGMAIVSATGTNSPFEYRINNGSFSASNEFSDLANGDYNITVKDATGCTITVSATIGKGDSGVSWSNDVKSIIEGNCAVSGCHITGAQSPNFSVFNNVKNSASHIKTRTANGSMPPDGKLSKAEIDMIGCWVDEGAKDN